MLNHVLCDGPNEPDTSHRADIQIADNSDNNSKHQGQVDNFMDRQPPAANGANYDLIFSFDAKLKIKIFKLCFGCARDDALVGNCLVFFFCCASRMPGELYLVSLYSLFLPGIWHFYTKQPSNINGHWYFVRFFSFAWNEEGLKLFMADLWYLCYLLYSVARLRSRPPGPVEIVSPNGRITVCAREHGDCSTVGALRRRMPWRRKANHSNSYELKLDRFAGCRCRWWNVPFAAFLLKTNGLQEGGFFFLRCHHSRTRRWSVFHANEK